MSQSNWEQGVGLGLSYADYKESSTQNLNNVFAFETILKSSINIWTAYNVSPVLKISTSPGFSWKGGRQVSNRITYEGVYFDLPILLHRTIINRLSISTGVAYNYMIHLGEGSDRESYNLTSSAENRHFISFISGLTYRLSNIIDINVNYSQSLNTVYQYKVINNDGVSIADIGLKNRGMQLLLTFHH